MKFLNQVEVEVEITMAKGEAEMRSSHLNGKNRGLGGSSFLAFVSLLVVMVAAPALAVPKHEGKMWGYVKKDKTWETAPLKHASSMVEARDKAVKNLTADTFSEADVKEAINGFTEKNKDGVNQFVALAETLSIVAQDIVKKDATKAEANLNAWKDKVIAALDKNAEDFGKNWLKDREEESKSNTEGIKMMVEKLVEALKANGFKMTDEDMNKLLKDLLKNPELLEELGMKLKADKKEPKKDDEKGDGKGKKNPEPSPSPSPAPVPTTQPTPGPEQPPVACIPQNNGLSPEISRLMESLGDAFNQLRRQANPGEDLLAQAQRQNPEAQAQQPQQQPIQPQNDQRRQDDTPEESLAKDQEPQPQPNPMFGDIQVPPTVLANALKKPEYKKLAEDGAKEKAALSSENATAKALSKRADTFLKNDVPTLMQGLTLPNGQLNPAALANASGSLTSMELKTRGQAQNVATEVEGAKARLETLRKELKGITAENSRLDDSEKALKELTNAESLYTQELQRKTNQCSQAQIPQDKQTCQAAQQQITSALQQIKAKKTEQQDLVNKSDKNFDETYVAGLKEQASALEAEIRSGTKLQGELEEKADSIASQGKLLQSQAVAAMYPQTGSTTGAKLTAGPSNRRTGLGSVMSAGANQVAGGVGRGGYAPGSRNAPNI